ncbi:SLATT domain-containing protein [Simiduia sp. 21SJ11W-1]|uniref:SLATT domain-containing protein n=1 Tax=Simiduia sp. 21SJ11W-1 TaxID=2909669 RepID=UPI00209E1463|nr:SLATT domain-containing protein [Simiduia sp. 21SJ11W-1]UTA48144.1 SLATT domain-containing protein [Simiduia sp. 21SJ11W-1]
MESVPYTIEVIEKLRWNSHLGKHSHFYASQSGRHLHIICGIPIVLINLILGSVFFALLGTELPDWSKWVGAILALTAALLGGVQTFFNFKKSYEGHREIGNEYLAVARECERLIALYFDQILDLEHLSNKIESLNSQYSSINQRAEEYIVTEKAYKKALEAQNKKAEKEPSLVQKMQSAKPETNKSSQGTQPSCAPA